MRQVMCVEYPIRMRQWDCLQKMMDAKKQKPRRKQPPGFQKLNNTYPLYYKGSLGGNQDGDSKN